MSKPPIASPQTTIEIDWSEEPPPVYCNGAQILSTQREFSIAFTEFAAFAGRGGEPMPKAKVVANLRIPPDIFFQLAAACAANWNKYVESHGDPEVGPRFEVIGAELPENREP